MEAYPPEPWFREIRKKMGCGLQVRKTCRSKSTNIIYMGEGGGGGVVEFEFELDSSAL